MVEMRVDEVGTVKYERPRCKQSSKLHSPEFLAIDDLHNDLFALEAFYLVILDQRIEVYSLALCGPVINIRLPIPLGLVERSLKVLSSRFERL